MNKIDDKKNDKASTDGFQGVMLLANETAEKLVWKKKNSKSKHEQIDGEGRRSALRRNRTNTFNYEL